MVRLLAVLALLVPLFAAAGTPPARLRVQVRDSAPSEQGGYHRSADGGYVAGTGAGAGSDRVGNGATWSTNSAPRELVLTEGEAVRVDLPSVQSLQFHVPPSPTPAGPASAPKAAGSSGPSASGVVYFDAVSAFSARFHRQGNLVRIDLVPLRTGGVAAPFVDAQGSGGALQHPVSVTGRLGDWIALGDTELSTPARSLMPTAEAPSAPGVWVRVLPADDQP